MLLKGLSPRSSSAGPAPLRGEGEAPAPRPGPRSPPLAAGAPSPRPRAARPAPDPPHTHLPGPHRAAAGRFPAAAHNRRGGARAGPPRRPGGSRELSCGACPARREGRRSWGRRGAGSAALRLLGLKSSLLPDRSLCRWRWSTIKLIYSLFSELAWSLVVALVFWTTDPLQAVFELSLVFSMHSHTPCCFILIILRKIKEWIYIPMNMNGHKLALKIAVLIIASVPWITSIWPVEKILGFSF